MGSLVNRLTERGLTSPPKFIKDGMAYECIMGSTAYGCNLESKMSDVDVYGFCIPPKEIVFPHTEGHINGFGKRILPKRFDQFQQHHIDDPEHRKEYDVTVYNIVKYFQLLMENNPNMVDSLFVPQRCILYSSQIGNHVRENRRLFLHKGSWHKFKGYAYSMLNKIKGKKIKEWFDWCQEHNWDYEQEPAQVEGLDHDHLGHGKKLWKQVTQSGKVSKRVNLIKEYGYDTKFAYHIVRLLLEEQQILETGDLILDRDREIYKSIRAGEWSMEKFFSFYDQYERVLEDLQAKSSLPNYPEELKIRQLLYECLEMHYGSIDKCVVNADEYLVMINKIRDIVGR